MENKIKALKKNGKIIWPATVSDAVLDRSTKKPISKLLHRYYLSGKLLKNFYGIGGALDLAERTIKTDIEPGIIIDFFSESNKKLESWQLVNPVPQYLKKYPTIRNWKISGQGKLNESDHMVSTGPGESEFSMDITFPEKGDSYFIGFYALLSTGDSGQSKISLKTEDSSVDLLISEGNGSQTFYPNKNLIQEEGIELDRRKKYYFKILINDTNSVFYIIDDNKEQYFPLNFRIKNNKAVLSFILGGNTRTSDCYNIVEDLTAYSKVDNIKRVVSPKDCIDWQIVNGVWEKLSYESQLLSAKDYLDNKLNSLDKKLTNSQTTSQGELQNRIEQLENKINSQSSSLNEKIDNTRSELTSKITTNEGNINSLSEKLDKVSKQVSDLSTKEENDIKSLENKIVEEKSDLDKKLSTRIDKTNSQLELAKTDIQKLRTDLTDETQARKTTDASLGTNLTNLTNAVNTYKSTLESSIVQEANIRESNDRILQTSIDNERDRAVGEETAIKNKYGLATEADIISMF